MDKPHSTPDQPPNDKKPDDDEKDDDVMRTMMDQPAVSAEDSAAGKNFDPHKTFVEPEPSGTQPSSRTEPFSAAETSTEDVPASNEKSGYDNPQATSSDTAAQQADTQEKQADFDPHATMMEQPDMYQTMAPTRRPGASGSVASPASEPSTQRSPQGGTTTAPPSRKGEAAAGTPKTDTGTGEKGGAGLGERINIDGLLNQMQGPSVFANMQRTPLLGLYAGVVFLSTLGLALVARFLVLLLIYGDFEFGRLLLAVVGVALAVGFYVAFEYIPLFGGAQARLDRLDLEKAPSVAKVEEPFAPPNPWLIALAVLLTVTGLLGGGLIFDAWDSIGVSGVSQLFAIILGGVGGALVGGLSLLREPRKELNGAAERRFAPLQLVRPLGVGLGVIFLAAGLQLVRVSEFSFEDGELLPQPGAEDLPVYFLLALLGMYGIAGQSLRSLPLRLHQILSRTMVGLVAAVLTVALMSIFTMLLDGTGEDPTLRFAYSPRYLIATMDDSNIFLMSLLGIYLSASGVLAGLITLESVNDGVLAPKQHRQQMLGLTLTVLFLTMVFMLVVFPLLSLLPLSTLFEAWLLVLLPLAFLSGLLWVAKTRERFIPAFVKQTGRLINLKPKALPSWVHQPLQAYAATDAATVRSLLSWQRGVAFVLVFTAIAPALALSFWFWIIVFVGILFVLGGGKLRRPTPSPSVPPSAAKRKTSIDPNSPAPTPSVSDNTVAETDEQGSAGDQNPPSTSTSDRKKSGPFVDS